MIMDEVSETALITLLSRVIESGKPNPVIHDPVGVECFKRLETILTFDQSERLIKKKLPVSLTKYIALRARKYDNYTRAFMNENPGSLAVNLGCGFDTRYWRVCDREWRYIEIDLPGVIKLKKQLLGDIISYDLVGTSVLENEWIEKVRSLQSDKVLFLAEGLFMYLPRDGVVNLFKRLSDTFTGSQIVFETVHEKYTRGIWKKMVEGKMRRRVRSSAGSYYQFGVRNATEIEGFGHNIRVVEEWSYFEDADIKPSIFRLFRHFKALSRTQWTIRALLE